MQMTSTDWMPSWLFAQFSPFRHEQRRDIELRPWKIEVDGRWHAFATSGASTVAVATETSPFPDYRTGFETPPEPRHIRRVEQMLRVDGDGYRHHRTDLRQLAQFARDGVDHLPGPDRFGNKALVGLVTPEACPTCKSARTSPCDQRHEPGKWCHRCDGTGYGMCPTCDPERQGPVPGFIHRGAMPPVLINRLMLARAIGPFLGPIAILSVGGPFEPVYVRSDNWIAMVMPSTSTILINDRRAVPTFYPPR